MYWSISPAGARRARRVKVKLAGLTCAEELRAGGAELRESAGDGKAGKFRNGQKVEKFRSKSVGLLLFENGDRLDCFSPSRWIDFPTVSPARPRCVDPADPIEFEKQRCGWIRDASDTTMVQ